MWGIPLGLAAANIGEWVIHKYLLHNLGRRKKSIWAFHWHQHHREVRRHKMIDTQYVAEAEGHGEHSRELTALLIGGVVAGAALIYYAPFFVLTVWYRMYRYYIVHRRSHLDSEWAKTNLPWHYDHHMGKTQNANWCVTHPWFDHVMGTRKVYAYENGVAVEVAMPDRPLLARLIEGFRESWATRRPRLPAVAVPEEAKKQTA